MRKVGTLGIVLIGVWVLVGVIGALWYSLSVATLNTADMPKPLAIALALLPAVASAVVGAFLVFRGAWIADRLLPDADMPIGIAPDTLLRVGLILAGVLLIAEGVPALIRNVTTPIVDLAVLAAQAGVSVREVGLTSELGRILPNALSALVTAGIGWFLIARSERLTNRLLGVPSPVADEPSRSLSTCPSCGAEYDPTDYVGGLAEPRCSACGQPLPHV